MFRSLSSDNTTQKVIIQMKLKAVIVALAGSAVAVTVALAGNDALTTTGTANARGRAGKNASTTATKVLDKITTDALADCVP